MATTIVTTKGEFKVKEYYAQIFHELQDSQFIEVTHSNIDLKTVLNRDYIVEFYETVLNG
jgi:hypothetical protein